MVEFLLAQFQDLPMSSYGSCASWSVVVSPHDISQTISPPPVRWMVDAPAPMVENGRSGGRLELN